MSRVIATFIELSSWQIQGTSRGHFLKWIEKNNKRIIFHSVQLLSRVWLFATPWIAARQASLSITISWSLPKLIHRCIQLVMPSSHLILCHPLLLLPPIPPSIRVFSNVSTLRMRLPKYWSFSFNISPSNEQDWSPLGWTGWLSLQSKRLGSIKRGLKLSRVPHFRSLSTTANNIWLVGQHLLLLIIVP